MALTKSQLLDVAQSCHTSFHKYFCAPVDLFEVRETFNGDIYLLPNHERGINYFYGETMTFIADYLYSHHVLWRVISLDGSVMIKLLDD